MLKRFMECIDYRITEGQEYGWQCFGDRAYSLDSWNGDQNGHSVSITFDRDTHACYSLEAFDYTNQRAYRWIAPDVREVFDAEVKSRGIDDVAWEGVNFVDLEEVDDFFDKARAIVEGKPYDTRVQVPVDFSDNELLKYMKIAHERDITFNQLIEEALREAIAQHL